jgi:hypothetical protein
MSKLPRVADIVLPLLKDAGLYGPYGDVGERVYTWIPDVDYRNYPLIEVRRVGGGRHARYPVQMGFPVIELSAYTNVGLPETEQLFEDALEVLYDAVFQQTMTDAGHLSSMKETMGATQFGSPFQDSWKVMGLIKLGIRPPKPHN